MIWIAAAIVAVVTAVAYWARRRFVAVRAFARLLHEAAVQESQGNLAAADAALAKAANKAEGFSRMMKPPAMRAVSLQRVRLSYRKGDLDTAATLTYELLQQARAST